MTTTTVAVPPAATVRREARPALLALGGGALVLVAVTLWHLTQGDAGFGLADVWDTVRGTAPANTAGIVTGSRLPRTLAGLLVGASLALAGALFQAGTRNPLAEPATIGVNAGAWCAVVATTLAGIDLSGLLRGGAALVGGLAAAALVLVISALAGGTPARLVLTGTAVHLSLSAVTALLLMLDENQAPGLFFWGQGTLVQVNANKGLQFLPVVLVVGAATVLLGRRLDLLRLDDDSARALGLRPAAERMGAVGVGVVLCAVGVAVAGPLSFVGLVAPHLVRRVGLVRHRLLLPAAALWGAVLVLAADGAVQQVRTEVSFGELPAGVATALVGAPFLLVLARRTPAGGLGGEAGGLDATRRGRPIQAGRRWIRPGPAVALALVLLVAAGLAGLALGEVAIPLGDTIAALAGGGDDAYRSLVLENRLPRVLVAALAGASFAVSGAAIQAVGRNPLAEPYLLGINGGAAVGALGLLILFPLAPVSLVPVVAFAGAVLALGVVLAVSWRGGWAPERLLLVGVAVAAFTAAVISLLVVLSGPRIAQALVWLTGSTYARGMEDVLALVAWPAVLVPAFWMASRHLDLLALGDEAPRALGLRLDRARFVLLGGAVLLAAAAVANVGAVGFIGLIAPHAARSVTGNRHRWLVPLSALLGAIVLVVADVVGRVVAAPSGIPSGLVVALVGTPAFLLMLVGRRS